jgi:type IV secretory pathway VirB2 component (pilin)
MGHETRDTDPREPVATRGPEFARTVRNLADIDAIGVGLYRGATKPDWFAIVVLVTEILILLVAAAGVYAALRSY